MVEMLQMTNFLMSFPMCIFACWIYFYRLIPVKYSQEGTIPTCWNIDLDSPNIQAKMKSNILYMEHLE